MAAGKEIRSKIKSVENTKKITKAMEMVAASKMRKAQDRMRAARPYSDKIRNIASHLAQANPEYTHPFLIKQDNAKAVGFIVVTTDKGLCGGMNTNVLRLVTNKVRELETQGNKVEAVAIGNKGLGFLNRIGAKVVSHAVQLGDTPHLDKLIGPVKVMLDAYQEGELDAVYLVYTKFINTMKQEPMMEQLLPLAEHRMQADKEQPFLGLHLRAGCADRDRRTAGALRRGADLPGGGGKPGVRAIGADGGDEVRFRQRRQRDRRTEADLQQDPPGRDHQGTVRDRRGRGCGLIELRDRVKRSEARTLWDRVKRSGTLSPTD